MIRVILMIDYSSEFDRRLLRGIIRYTKENGPWLFLRMSSDPRSGGLRYRKVMEMARKWKADAIIGRWNDEDIKLLDKLDIPIVLQNYRNRSTEYSNITGDYKGTGVMAARYFWARRHTSYAFFGIRDVVWSEERQAGFREEVERCRGQFRSYLIPEPGMEDRAEIAEWLRSLPERTALFCCDDERALIITEICRIENIDVPRQVSVLGVDNDDLICSISDPPISSVELDVEQGGYMLCKRLHAQIMDPSASHFSIVINPVAVKERQSTSFYVIADPAVMKVVNHINENYMKELNVKQMLELVPLSRRSIESRFRKEMGMSIYQYVLECRILRVAQLLLTTNKSLPDIASEAGIQDYNSLSKLFRRRMNCTPSEYRQKFCVFSN